MRNTVSLDDMLAKLPAERRARIAARAAELIAEDMTLRDLRKAAGKTQAALAAELGVKQASIAKLEARADMLLSTLAAHVRKLGGRLDLVVSFPDRPPARLTGLAPIGLAGGESGDAKPKRRGGKPVARAA